MHVFWNSSHSFISRLSCAMLSCSVVSDLATPLTVGRQSSLFMGILQTRLLEWVPYPAPARLS